MGSCFSIQMSCDSLITRCWYCTAGQVVHVWKLKDNLEKLQISRDELRVLKTDLMLGICNEEGPGMKRLEQVQLWLSRVEENLTEVDQLITDGPQEIEKLYLGGFCSRNYKSSYRFGKRISKRLSDAVSLKQNGVFEIVVVRAPKEPVVERPSEPTIGLDSLLYKVWDCLMEEVGVIGIYGMGGIGKTTLLTQINNNFLHTVNDFDVVIWVVVSKDLRLEKVQEDIWKQIGFYDEKWVEKSFEQKANDVFDVLRRKKFVLLLDDVWERIDLTKVGVPHLERQNGSKIVLTTRSKALCAQMDAQKIIKVKPLKWENAWELFRKKAGEDLLNSDPNILPLAQSVARECSGLPIARITISRAMACRDTVEEWKHVLEVLRNSASNLQGMEDEVFQGMEIEVFTLLKFSYDSLPNDRVRSCFLYCSLFSEDFNILKDELVRYWICENFCTHNEGFNTIGTLVRACLLEEEGRYVKMHDVIRDLALWIAYKCDQEKGKFLVKTGAQFTEALEAENWQGVRRISLMANSFEELPNMPKCNDLLTLFLCHNQNLHIISGSFFQFMNGLTVLDLSETGIEKLPPEISKLVSLQYLNLSHTRIRDLPLELKMLEKLKHLNLEQNGLLQIIPRQVIYSLSMLQVLRMFGCGSNLYPKEKDNTFADGNTLIKELQCLKHLSELSITIRSASALHSFFYTPKLLICTRALLLEWIDGLRSLDISLFVNMKNLDKLEINTHPDLEELSVVDVEPMIERTEMQALSSLHNSLMLRERCLYSIREVSVHNCYKLKDLTWLILAPNLTILRVHSNNNMVEIICATKLGELNIIPFSKLEVLELRYLPELNSIYWNVLPFPFLKKIEVLACPLLRKLPLNSNSAKGCKVVIEAQEDWWNYVEWEDDASKAAFLQYFKPHTYCRRSSFSHL